MPDEAREAVLDALRRRVAELEAKGARVQRGLAESRVGVWEFDLDASTLTLVQAWAEMFGYGDEEMADPWRLWQTACHPDDRPVGLARLRELKEGLRDVAEETFRIRAKCGEWRQLFVRAYVVECHDDGSPRHAGGICMDVTDLRKAQEALVESEARFRRIAETFPGVIWMTKYDADYTPLHLSGSVEEIFGYPIEDFMEGRRHFTDLVHPEDRERVDKAVQEALDRRERYDTWSCGSSTPTAAPCGCRRSARASPARTARSPT